MDKRVREISRFFVAPRCEFVPAVWRVSRTLLSRNTSTSVSTKYHVKLCIFPPKIFYSKVWSVPEASVVVRARFEKRLHIRKIRISEAKPLAYGRLSKTLSL